MGSSTKKIDNVMLSGFVWRFLERWGAQGVTFVVSIVLARVLDPSVYGVISLVTVFISILQVFLDSGLATALIQKKDADDLDFSTVFWANMVLSICLYLCLFFLSPFLADFFGVSNLYLIIRVLGLTVLISGVKSIQQAYVTRNMLFKKFFFSTLGGTICAAISGITLAYAGWGVWALVCQYLINNLIDTCCLWWSVKWRPKICFSWNRYKALFSYGSKIMLSGLIDTIYNDIRTFIIGKYYTTDDLAYYNRGKQFPEMIVQNITISLNSVLLPVLANKQDDLKEVKGATKKVLQSSSMIIFPAMIGLFLVSKNLVLILLTEKWLPAVFFLQAMCFVQLLQPLQTTNLTVIKALGHSSLCLKLEIIKKSISLIIVIVTAFIGVEAIAVGAIFYAIIATVINAFPMRSLIGYGYIEQLKDLLPFASMSALMGIVVYFVGLMPLSPFLLLCMQVLSGVAVYIILLFVFKIDTITQLFKGRMKR